VCVSRQSPEALTGHRDDGPARPGRHAGLAASGRRGSRKLSVWGMWLKARAFENFPLAVLHSCMAILKGEV